MMLGYSVW